MLAQTHTHTHTHTQRRDRRWVSSGRLRRDLNDQFSPLHGHYDICDIQNQWRASTICLFPDDKHHILLSVNAGLCEMWNKAAVFFFSKLPQHFPERNEQYWWEDYQAKPPPVQFNNLFAVYLPTMFILPTTQRNMLGRFEEKKNRQGCGRRWSPRRSGFDPM